MWDGVLWIANPTRSPAMPIYIGEGWSHAGTSPTRSCGRASGLAATQFWGRSPQKDGDRGVVRRRVLVLDVFQCWCGKGSPTWICLCLQESSEPDLQRLCTNKTVKDAAWRVGLLQPREGGLSITFYCASLFGLTSRGAVSSGKGRMGRAGSIAVGLRAFFSPLLAKETS